MSKRIILCPNPNRDPGMKATKAAEAILHEIGFETVVCSPFRDQKEGAFGEYETQPLPHEIKNADLLITFGMKIDNTSMSARMLPLAVEKYRGK